MKLYHKLLFFLLDFLILFLSFLSEINLKRGHFLFDFFLFNSKRLVLLLKFKTFLVKSSNFLLNISKRFFHVTFNFLSFFGFLFNRFFDSLLNLFDCVFDLLDRKIQSLFIFKSFESFFTHFVFIRFHSLLGFLDSFWEPL